MEVLEEPSWAKFEAVDLSKEALGASDVQIQGKNFVDAFGRVLQLRGSNVSGASKLPSKPDALKGVSIENFFNYRTVSFVGRPFQLSEAPLHLKRLKAWGHSLVRLLVTWEALSHAGPNEIDVSYIDYLDQLLSLMSDFGFKVIICAHQDVWSRYSGGSGAPAWTFEKAGFDLRAFKETGAAFISQFNNDHEQKYSGAIEPAKGKKEPVGAFVWPSGYQKLAAATMATLFWAGEKFTWKLNLQSEDKEKGQVNIQEYLQFYYIESFGHLLDRVGHHDAVIGFDLINEPHRGFIGMQDWNNWCYETDLHIGHFPSLLQSLALGSGHKQDISFYVKSWPFPTRKSHETPVDPKGQSVWNKRQCIWKDHGVWKWDEARQRPVALRQDYFSRDPRPESNGERIEWYRDCYAPFIDKFTKRIHQKHPHLFCFIEPIPNEFIPKWSNDGKNDNKMHNGDVETFIDIPHPKNFVFAPHFYDLNVLFSKLHTSMSVNVQSLSRGGFIFNALFFGKQGLQKNYRRQISNLVENARLSLGEIPIIIGEIGIPFDINNRTAFKTGNHSKQAELLEALIEAMENKQIGFTLWNYNPDNSTNSGDGWNQEDFSLMCNEVNAADYENPYNNLKKENEIQSLYSGGRCLKSIIRPYAVKVAGIPLSSNWDIDKREFTLQYQASIKAKSDEACTTQIFIPQFHYDGYHIEIKVNFDCKYHLDLEKQTLSIKHNHQAISSSNPIHTIDISANRRISSNKLTIHQQNLWEQRDKINQRQREISKKPFAILSLFFIAIIAIFLSRIL